MLQQIEIPFPSSQMVPFGDLWNLEAATFRKKKPFKLSTKILDLTKIPEVEARVKKSIFAIGLLPSRRNRILVTEDYQRL